MNRMAKVALMVLGLGATLNALANGVAADAVVLDDAVVDITAGDGQFGPGVQDHGVDGIEFRSVNGKPTETDGQGYWRLVTGSTMEAPLKLPSGVRITGVHCPILADMAGATGISLVKRSFNAATGTPSNDLVVNAIGNVTGYGALEASTSHVYRPGIVPGSIVET